MLENALVNLALARTEVADDYLVTDRMILWALFVVVWVAVAISLARRVHAMATGRGQNVGVWTALTLVFSAAGYAAYRIHDDCRSRRINDIAWPLVVLVLAAWILMLPILAVFSFDSILSVTPFYKQSLTRPVTIIKDDAPRFVSTWPWYMMIVAPLATFLGPCLVFSVVYMLARPRLTLDMIRERLERNGQLEPTDGKLLKVEDLVKYFPVKKGVFGSVVGHVKAVDGVSFAVEPGKTLGLVGESGCGKTTTGRLILNLLEPTSGRMIFDGVDLSLLSPGEMRTMRRRMQLIFQDPFGSLNPRMTVLSIVGEALAIHGVARGRERIRRVEELLEKVGLDRRHLRRYPHEFSGGQRQRIGIARALALNPRFIVCDEPVSALDVSIQAQIINLLRDLQKEMGLTYLFIAHDLSVVEHISDDVAVMYLGHIVEKAPSKDLYATPLHPYTMALMSAVPVPDPGRSRHEIILEGDVPSPLNPPSGCVFHTRCRYMKDECKTIVPELREIERGHFAACIRVEEVRRDTEIGET